MFNRPKPYGLERGSEEILLRLEATATNLKLFTIPPLRGLNIVVPRLRGLNRVKHHSRTRAADKTLA